MNWYSSYPAQRARQIIADLVGLAAVILVIITAVSVTTAIRALASFGRDLEAAGESFATGLADAGDQLGAIPLVGEGIRAPLDAAAGAGGAVADAGRGQQELVEAIAVGAGWVVALLPLLVLALVWALPRVLFARRSGLVRRMLAQGLTADTLAARALARQPLRALVGVHPDPAAAWRAGDPDVVRALAGLELRRAGVLPTVLPGALS
ncbi:hypothetical protein [Yonghaparkia sp. Root332]|uniref:hypothetical protein n=1 Tax=Yonghaparkia sp. Root332 TaxID=1736516 RepID=UPI0006FEDE9E|nr:hypothetical protein [Yonghaparkia sp. Root332]KQV24971.1 hypothetical protein ASC54_10885 [Yonghaparkia sp. Root332]